MNYIKIYNKLVSNKTKRKKDETTYYELHHIIPKCLGGSDEPSNLVLLTAREHFVSHRLLSKIHPQDLNLKLAVLFMASIETLDQTYKVNSHTYSTLKRQASEARRVKASHPNTMEFIHNIKVPSALVKTVHKLNLYSGKSKIFRKALNKYIANLIVCTALGMSLSYSRDNSLKIKGSTSTYLLLKCEALLIETGYILAEIDSKSPLANRKKCRIDPCISEMSVLDCTQSVLRMNQRTLEETMGDCFRKLFQVDIMVPVGVGFRNESGEVQEYKILV